MRDSFEDGIAETVAREWFTFVAARSADDAIYERFDAA
jgi:hypothetical protein